MMTTNSRLSFEAMGALNPVRSLLGNWRGFLMSGTTHVPATYIGRIGNVRGTRKKLTGYLRAWFIRGCEVFEALG
jgi:hypothetical protein